MPKGKSGCFACGAGTVLVVQAWLRAFSEEEKDRSGNRRQITTASIERYFCEPCGRRVFGLVRPALERRHLCV